MEFFSEIRCAVRGLVKDRSLIVVALLTLAVGVGANTAVFSVINSVLLRSLPYNDPDQLVMVWHKDLKRAWRREMYVPAPAFLDWAKGNVVFEQLAAFTFPESHNLSDAQEPERVRGAAISRSLLATLGTAPHLGRSFTTEDEVSARNAIVLSDGLWKRRYGSKTDILGSSITVDDKDFLVVGILPPGFELPFSKEIDLFFALGLNSPELSNRRNHALHVVGRLKPGISVARAQSDMDTIAARLQSEYPDTDRDWGANVVGLREDAVGKIRPTLLRLMVMAVFVLLIACVNVASLLVARSSLRIREFAVRAALGAGSLRLVRQILLESLLLSVCGGGLAMLFTAGVVRVLTSLGPAQIPRLSETTVDSRVWLFALGVSVATALLFGLIPAAGLAKPDLRESLVQGSRSVTGHRRHERIRAVLLVSEIALAVVLLSGAGLLVRSMLRLEAVNPGFRPDHVLTAKLSLRRAKYSDAGQVSAFYSSLLERVGSQSTVASAALVSHLPMSGTGINSYFAVPGTPKVAAGQEYIASSKVVSSGYFQTMGIPVLKGRPFTAQDAQGTLRVVIVNRTMARRLFPGEDPVGKGLSILAQAYSDTDVIHPAAVQIVGVVEDVKHGGLDEAPGLNELYVPYLQNPAPSMYLVVRAEGTMTGLVALIRRAAAELDPRQPLYQIRTMEERISESLAPRRFNMFLLCVFAGIAFLLAAGGVYGVVSYSVSQRRSEIGIRMAVGAGRPALLKMIVGRAMRLTLIGLAVGVPTSVAVSRVIASLLYGTSPYDPLTLAAVSLVLLGSAAFASYLPARRATRIDPLTALRIE